MERLPRSGMTFSHKNGGKEKGEKKILAGKWSAIVDRKFLMLGDLTSIWKVD